MRHIKLFGVLLLGLPLLAACGGGSSADPDDDPAAQPDPTPDPVVSFGATKILISLAEPEDEDEIEELREDFAALLIERIGTTSFFVLTIPAGEDPVRFVADLDDDFRVVISELDYVASAPEGGPSGSATLGSELIDLIASQRALDPLQLATAHATSRGAGVVVAVVDTGVDASHPFLAGRIAPGGRDFIDDDNDPREERNFIDDDGDGRVDGDYGHGTFVASLVLAVAPDALVLPVRVLDDEGFGTASSVAAGIVWAVDMGADIVNFSIDMPVESEAVKKAIEFARDRGVIVVGAAGNGGDTKLQFPARFDRVVAVAAVDNNGIIPPFSNVGSKVDFVAPGTDILGAVTLDLNPFGTARWSGTSFSTPIVAGSLALLRAAFPAEDARALVDRLEATAQPLDAMNPQHSERLGAGLVRPAAAMAR